MHQLEANPQCEAVNGTKSAIFSRIKTEPPIVPAARRFVCCIMKLKGQALLSAAYPSSVLWGPSPGGSGVPGNKELHRDGAKERIVSLRLCVERRVFSERGHLTGKC